MQQPLEHTRSHRMHHFSTFPGAHACPTPAPAFPGPTAPGSMVKIVIVTLLAMILAWRPSIAMLLGRLVLRLWPNFRRA